MTTVRYWELRVLAEMSHIARRYPDGDLRSMDDAELAECIAFVRMRQTERERAGGRGH